MIEHILEKVYPVKYRERWSRLAGFNWAKNNWGVILAGFLWFCLWATYNTDITRIFLPGFSYNKLDLIHGLRSLLPFVAIILAVTFLLKKRHLPKNFFLTPLGLLGIYTIIGIFSSVFSKNPLMALYWSVLYGSAIIVLLAVLVSSSPIKKLFLVININWVIGGILAFGLFLFFLIQPGVISSLTYNFLICSQRPYEGLGNIGAAINTFGMAGTRPTGLGRYAGLVAIIAFVSFCFAKKRFKFIWFLTFIIFLGILLFSKGKTEMLAFIIAMVFVIWLTKKINIFSVLAVCFVSLLSAFIIFYNIPCTNSISFITSPISQFFAVKNITDYTTKPVSNTSTTNTKNSAAITFKTNVSTLSGRTGGVWLGSWYLFLSNPLFGYGFQADRFFLNGQHAHNSIIHALVQTGILGTIPFVLAFILTFIILLKLFKRPNIADKDKYFLIGISAVLVFFVVRSITESVAFFSADWLFVAPIIAYIQCLGNSLNSREINYNKNLVLNFLGNKINIITVKGAIEKMSSWIKFEHSKMHWIVVTGMHGIVEAEKHADFKYIVSHADMFVPDGISLVWLARARSFDIKKRISGADLTSEFFKISEKENFKNFFYGDTEDTLKALCEKFPKIRADFYSPPFRELTEKEDKEIIEKINQAHPDVLWVGLGLPKQERWIFEHREKLNVPVVIGVGAAFKFLSGKVKRAPKWIGDAGFEWLWRFLHEPKTTWKRVLVDMPFFVWLALRSFFQVDFKEKIIRLFRSWARNILLFAEKNILFPIGIFVGPKLLEQLTPYDVRGFEEKIRLGNLSDCGYVIPSKILSSIDTAYSYGVGWDVSFEEDLVRQLDINVRLYDHTLDALPKKNKNLFFKKQGIANRKYGDFDTFKNNLEENGDVGKKIILKLDVEGSEWKVMDKIIDKSSKDIMAIVLELHRLYRYEKIMSYVKLLKKINSKFTLVHLHGNNTGELFIFGNKKIPGTLELTLISNDLIAEKSVMARSLPSEKDCPNMKGKEDILLDFWRK